MRHRVLAVACGFCAIAGASVCAEAADWPTLRGPNGNGSVTTADSIAQAPFTFEPAWVRKLGKGYSGVAVASDRVFTMYADGDSDWVAAFDRGSGSQLWLHRIGDMYPSRGGSEGGPNGFPVVDADVLYGLGSDGNLFAMHVADGEMLWSLRIDETLGARPPMFGFATTPLVVGDLLFVQTGGPGGKALAAFDKAKGTLRWSLGDDEVGYQSPILATLGGREQIVAVTNRRVLGIAPDSADLLWSHDHGLSRDDGSSIPVLLGDDRFLLAGNEASVAFAVRSGKKGWVVEERWRTTKLKGSLAAPVVHEGHIYGFDGAFLSCLDAKQGKPVWKSRPPGGNGLILVDGQLVIYAKGAVIVAAASPEGYRERSRIELSDRGSYTWPSFSDGMIFVRNVEQMAAARIVAADLALAPGADGVGPLAGPPAGEEPEAAREPRAGFERFLADLQSADDKPRLLDAYLESQPQFPIVERRLVHFVYRGPAQDVAVTGTMTQLGEEHIMQRVEGVDLFYKTFEVDPAARLEYRINVDFEGQQPDPRNSRLAPGHDGDRSEVLMPGYRVADHTLAYEGEYSGRIEKLELVSARLGATRQVSIYLPAGYDQGWTACPVVLALDGDAWLELARMPNSLNHLVGSRIAPTIVAFVHQPEGTAQAEFAAERSVAFVDMLADELIPRLDRTYRTEARPPGRALIGAGSAGMAAIRATVLRPDIFGNAAGLSVQLSPPAGDELLAGIGSSERSNAKIWIGWNRYDLRRDEWKLDLVRDSRRLAETLRDQGFRVRGGEAVDSAGWRGWAARVGEILETFFPL